MSQRAFALFCFFLSGTTGLVYQVLWSRFMGGIIGNTHFSITIVVAVFMGRQSSGGHSITLDRLERKGADLHITVERRSPAPGTLVTQVITSPFQFVAIEHKGATGDIYIDGQKQ